MLLRQLLVGQEVRRLEPLGLLDLVRPMLAFWKGVHVERRVTYGLGVGGRRDCRMVMREHSDITVLAGSG